MNIKNSFGTIALMLLVSGLLAACGGGGLPGTSTPTPTPTGATLTLSTIPNITGLTYNTSVSNSGTSTGNYARVWTNSAGNMLDLIYTTSSTEDHLGISITTSSSSYWAGTPTYNIICHVSGTNSLSWPLCSSWGITVSRSSGTLSLSNTPIFDMTTSATAGAANGSFSFPPF